MPCKGGALLYSQPKLMNFAQPDQRFVPLASYVDYVLKRNILGGKNVPCTGIGGIVLIVQRLVVWLVIYLEESSTGQKGLNKEKKRKTPAAGGATLCDGVTRG